MQNQTILYPSQAFHNGFCNFPVESGIGGDLDSVLVTPAKRVSRAGHLFNLGPVVGDHKLFIAVKDFLGQLRTFNSGQGGLEFDDVIFLSFEQKFGKPKRNRREEINHSHAHDLQSHERHHPLIDIQQFPLRHDSLDIVGR